MTPIFPPARLSGEQASSVEIVQRPLDCGAGEAQLRGYGADPRPAPPLTVCVIFEIHIDRSGPVAQVGMVDVLKISHTRYPHGRRLFWPSGGSSPGCPVLGQGSLPAAALPDAGAAPLAAGIHT